MNIEYLGSYFDNRNNLKNTCVSNARGIELQKIETLEAQTNKGKPFPKAFREYLFIGGDYPAIGLGPGYDVDDGDGIEYIQSIEVYKKLMAKEGLSLDRPFMVIKCGDDSSFDFIYLDEGDNPRPRFFYIDDNLRADEPRIGDFPEKTFSELIDRLVDFALRGLQPF